MPGEIKVSKQKPGLNIRAFFVKILIVTQFLPVKLFIHFPQRQK